MCSTSKSILPQQQSFYILGGAKSVFSIYFQDLNSTPSPQMQEQCHLLSDLIFNKPLKLTKLRLLEIIATGTVFTQNRILFDCRLSLATFINNKNVKLKVEDVGVIRGISQTKICAIQIQIWILWIS